MKRIKYFYNIPVNRGNEESPVWKDCLYQKELPYSELAEQIAKAEAYNGEYEVYDDEQPDPIEQPTQLDTIESQIAYLAIMTDCSEILEV